MRFNPSLEDCMYGRGSDDWRQLAEAARDEPDPIKLRELIEQLNHELKQRAERLYPVASENSDRAAGQSRLPDPKLLSQT
jgi:hypothetical protein